MERVALFGIGSEAIDIIKEIRELYWTSIAIESIFFNDSSWWGKYFSNKVIERPADIVNHKFDKLIVCGAREYADSIIPVLIGKTGIEKERIISYHDWIRVNIGKNEICWNNVNGSYDVIEELKKCGTLNDLENFYYNKPHREMSKYLHYFEIYDQFFKKYRDTECVIVEVGICKGGSLQMWKNYFGEKAQIIGIDIDESTLAFSEEQVTVEIGSQSDREFWREFKKKYPKVDIFIDDGRHTMEQQIITFEEMFEHVSETGIYLCEDMHTSYWTNYGGGYKKPLSYVEYSKNFVDYINAWYNLEMSADNMLTRTMHSLHYYDSVLVIEKRKVHRSVCIPMGK